MEIVSTVLTTETLWLETVLTTETPWLETIVLTRISLTGTVLTTENRTRIALTGIDLTVLTTEILWLETIVLTRIALTGIIITVLTTEILTRIALTGSIVRGRLPGERLFFSRVRERLPGERLFSRQARKPPSNNTRSSTGLPTVWATRSGHRHHKGHPIINLVPPGAACGSRTVSPSKHMRQPHSPCSRDIHVPL